MRCTNCNVKLEEWELCGRGYCEACEDILVQWASQADKTLSAIEKVDQLGRLVEIRNTRYWLDELGCAHDYN